MQKKPFKLLGTFGIVSALLYIAAWLVGGWLRPGYSARTQAVSELIETDAPNKRLLDVMIFGFHIFMIPFAYGLHIAINQGQGKKTGPLLLGCAGALGIVLTLFFPCDKGCEPVTWRGKTHIALAIPLGFMILFAILAFSKRLKKDEEWSGYSTYSLGTFLSGLLLGILSAIFAKSPVGGILERLVGISYQQWYIVMGIRLIQLKISER